MSLGNDVVDLDDPETRLAGLHARFDERAFSAGERAVLAAAPSRHVQHWTFWAAKESAYKALKRLEPGLVFSPREFEVHCPALPVGSHARATGKVFHRDRALELHVHLDASTVHAVAISSQMATRPLLTGVDSAGEDDPGAAVRRLATGVMAARLALAPGTLRIEGRPPVAWLHDRPLEAVVSLSHHGRFVAFAAALPH